MFSNDTLGIGDIEGDLKLFDHYKDGNTSKTFNVFVRAKYHFYVKANAISDHKAHILVSINSIFIGGVFILLQLDLDLTKVDLAILFFFLFSVIVSLVFATLSVRPYFRNSQLRRSQNYRNALSVMSLGKYQSEEFSTAFDATMQSQPMIYENVATDFYLFGQVLVAKNRLLNSAYNFFIGGLILTSVLFVIDFLVTRVI